MNTGRTRLTGLAWFGCASMTIASALLACEDDSSSAFTSTPDAAQFEAPDSSGPDATVDASGDAGHDATVDASGDAGHDATVAVVADVTSDFSTKANPNGAWTYGYAASPPSAANSAIVVYSAVSDATAGASSWYDPTNAVLGAPSAWRNDTTTVLNGVAPGEFAMHPGNAGEYAVVRWSAPAAGVYDVKLQFKTGDSGDTNGLLLHNGVELVSEDSTSAETVHALQVTLASGDYLDVAVGSKGNFLNDNTPVVFTIQGSASTP